MMVCVYVSVVVCVFVCYVCVMVCTRLHILVPVVLTSHRIQIRWSPFRTMGAEIGTDAPVSTSRAMVKEPSNKKARAWRTG